MVKLQFTFPRLEKRFKDRQRDIMLVLAASMQTNRSMMFDKDGADNGKDQWEKLKWRSGRPLQKTGVLRKSMAPRNDGIVPGAEKSSVLNVSGRTVEIGTNLLSARMMNDGTSKMAGGVLRPVKAKALKFPIPQNTKGLTEKEKERGFMFRKWVRIPARRMDEVTSEDQAEWSQTLSNYIASILNE